MPKTKEDRIKTVMGGGGHIVILGAGASIASTYRNPELNGKKLPSMDNFVDVVGLRDIIEKLPKHLMAKNFEELYSNLYTDNPKSIEILEIERRVYNYFKDMKLPNEPTIYDHLILSLRPKDIIATFNWDPFLYQAFIRNGHVADMPQIIFLHGTVALGYSKEDKRSGPAGMYSKATKNYFPPTKLLYPIGQKNYNEDEFIRMEWEALKHSLNSENTRRVTIFGYGAPVSDLGAVQTLNEAWGTSVKRNMEQFEIIDIRDEETVLKSWDNFIHSHHYDYSTDYFKCSLANNPRRTSESYFHHILPMTIDEAFSESNPVPKDLKTLEELWLWHKPLIDAENEWKKQSNKKDE
jgi:hypothetical protein